MEEEEQLANYKITTLIATYVLTSYALGEHTDLAAHAHTLLANFSLIPMEGMDQFSGSNPKEILVEYWKGAKHLERKIYENLNKKKYKSCNKNLNSNINK